MENISFIDILGELSRDQENLWFPTHMNFKTINTSTYQFPHREPTEKEMTKMQKLLSDNKLRKLSDMLNQITGDLVEQPVFKITDRAKGYPLNNLSWSEKEANLSTTIRFDGVVGLPDHEFSNLGEFFETYTFKNYVFIRFGQTNVTCLPVQITESTFNNLQFKGLFGGETYQADKIYVIDVQSISPFNKKEIQSPEDICKLQYELVKTKAQGFVINYLLKQSAPTEESGPSFTTTYGELQAEFLEKWGITETGFRRNLEKVADASENISDDQRKQLVIKVDKLSSPASKKDYDNIQKKRQEQKPFTEKEKLMMSIIKEYESVEDDNLLSDWLETKRKEIEEKKKNLVSKIAKMKLFSEHKINTDANEIELTIDDNNVKFKIEQ